MGIQGQVVHRPGSLRQSNKKHKSGSNSSKHASDKGRTSVKAVCHTKKCDLNRKDRRNKASQLRKNKRDAVLMKKRELGSSNAPPILVAVLSINGFQQDSDHFLENLKNCDDDLIINDNGHFHISSPRLKQRFTFIIPKYHDLYSVMDAAKVADTLLFIHSQDSYTEYTEKLLSILLVHACPSTVHIVQGIEKMNLKKKAEIKKEILKRMESRFPDEKLCHADTRTELQLLLRHIGSQKQKAVGFRDMRPYLLSEKVIFEYLDSESGKGTLKVTGYVRGQPLNVNKLIHIPGWGDFQMDRIVYEDDPYPVVARKKKVSNSLMDAEMAGSLNLVDVSDPTLQESLQSEIIPDPLNGEQTWPTEEELLQATEPKTSVKRVVEGTSDYQAGWIIESEDEEKDDDDSDSDDNSENVESESQSMVTAPEDMSDDEDNMESISEINEAEEKSFDYDKDIDMEEEEKKRVRFREERMEQMFPDERDTPMDVPARVRYQKYRGLKEFSTAHWDPMENLPLDYARIYRFENFRLTQKHVLKEEREGAMPGSYVTVHITNVPSSLYDSIHDDHPFILYGLLPHEQKMSVMNVIIKKHPLCSFPIKSKDELVFHLGFRRFLCKPIFSAHHAGNKFKYERFLPNDTTVVASFYAPVMFPPASVTVLRRTAEGDDELVATGSLMNIDPNRIIVKRVVLSGHMFKIFKKSAIIRYMFFNREDVAWFKKVQLKTKYGIQGEIREALGSHGHMKCKFERQLPSQDVVLMSLYKRIFPKWTYDPHVPSPLSINKDLESMMI